MDKIISLTKDLIAIQSISENPAALEDVLELALQQLKEYTIERFDSKGIKSALVYNKKNRPKKFRLLLNIHLDIIPAKDHQYNPEIKGNKLYGAGSMDMKGGAACMIFAFKEIANKVSFPVGLQIVTDEEVGGFNGTKYQIGKGVRADFIIAGEPTNFNIVNKAKGVLLLKINSKGKTAHGAYPWKGDNAILKMVNFLQKLQEEYPNPKTEKYVTTFNVSGIETTNRSFNKIPDNCSVFIDVRYIAKDSKNVLLNIKRLLPKGFKIEVVANEPPLFTEENNFISSLRNVSRKVLKKKVFLRSANGTSDARHFSVVKCSGIEFGPFGDGMGTDKEYIDVLSLKKYYEILKSFLLLLDSK